MYPFLRLGTHAIKSLVKHQQGQNLTLTDTGEITLTANINDMDNFLEMNNGRIFTLFDLGRNDFAIRSGLAGKLIKNRWGLVVAGSTIQYRKRIRLMDKVTIKTKIVAIDDRWIYVDQSMWVKGQPTCHALLRTGVTNIKTGKVIPTVDVLEAIGEKDFVLPPNEWVKAWAEADKLRPFPQAEK
ncbi:MULTISPECIES: acyl-CoA thioesterase [unclassified Moraxella]|uniref:acyl-CoA thioesterase n=1 Tax=unclassified Moraxella TaxID=2685852 RepID=UPI003AF72868